MKRDSLLWLLLGGGLLAWLYYNRTNIGSAVSSAGNAITSAAESAQAVFMGWENINQGPVWVPVINQSESAYGIPQNLLARQAYQESHFRQEIIDGTLASPAGALGILQLIPAYFTTVRVPIPFTVADTQAQISEAAQEMARLYAHFGDWGLALAGYNDGQGNVDAYVAGTRQLPAETTNYVTAILADIQLPSVMNA